MKHFKVLPLILCAVFAFESYYHVRETDHREVSKTKQIHQTDSIKTRSDRINNLVHFDKTTQR